MWTGSPWRCGTRETKPSLPCLWVFRKQRQANQLGHETTTAGRARLGGSAFRPTDLGRLVAARRGFLPRGGPPAALPAVAIAAVLAPRTAKGARHDLSCGSNGSRCDLQRSGNDLGAKTSCRRHGVPAFLRSAALSLLAALRLSSTFATALSASAMTARACGEVSVVSRVESQAIGFSRPPCAREREMERACRGPRP